MRIILLAVCAFLSLGYQANWIHIPKKPVTVVGYPKPVRQFHNDEKFARLIFRDLPQPKDQDIGNPLVWYWAEAGWVEIKNSTSKDYKYEVGTSSQFPWSPKLRYTPEWVRSLLSFISSNLTAHGGTLISTSAVPVRNSLSLEYSKQIEPLLRASTSQPRDLTSCVKGTVLQWQIHAFHHYKQPDPVLIKTPNLVCIPEGRVLKEPLCPIWGCVDWEKYPPGRDPVNF